MEIIVSLYLSNHWAVISNEEWRYQWNIFPSRLPCTRIHILFLVCHLNAKWKTIFIGIAYMKGFQWSLENKSLQKPSLIKPRCKPERPWSLQWSLKKKYPRKTSLIKLRCKAERQWSLLWNLKKKYPRKSSLVKPRCKANRQ